MSGICSEHQHHQPGCERCGADTPAAPHDSVERLPGYGFSSPGMYGNYWQAKNAAGSVCAKGMPRLWTRIWTRVVYSWRWEKLTHTPRGKSDLLPCPFCNKQSELRKINMLGPQYYAVWCADRDSCGGTGPMADTPAHAIKVWNTRASGWRPEPADALRVLRDAMQKDYMYAWSWHCNIAMTAIDAGAPAKEANERAADFMHRAFDVRTDHDPGTDLQEVSDE